MTSVHFEEGAGLGFAHVSLLIVLRGSYAILGTELGLGSVIYKARILFPYCLSSPDFLFPSLFLLKINRDYLIDILGF